MTNSCVTLLDHLSAFENPNKVWLIFSIEIIYIYNLTNNKTFNFINLLLNICTHTHPIHFALHLRIF